MGNYELIEFAKKQLELISGISKWRPYISNTDALEIIQSARRYKKNSKDEPFHHINCFNEETKEIEYMGISYKNTLKEFIIILLCDTHFLSKQQIKAFLTDYRSN